MFLFLIYGMSGTMICHCADIRHSAVVASGALQELTFYVAKGNLLPCKRPSFARLKTVFCKVLEIRLLRGVYYLPFLFLRNS